MGVIAPRVGVNTVTVTQRPTDETYIRRIAHAFQRGVTPDTIRFALDSDTYLDRETVDLFIAAAQQLLCSAKLGYPVVKSDYPSRKGFTMSGEIDNDDTKPDIKIERSQRITEPLR